MTFEKLVNTSYPTLSRGLFLNIYLYLHQCWYIMRAGVKVENGKLWLLVTLSFSLKLWDPHFPSCVLEIIILQIVVIRNKCNNVAERDVKAEKQNRHCGLPGYTSDVGYFEPFVYPLVLWIWTSFRWSF